MPTTLSPLAPTTESDLPTPKLDLSTCDLPIALRKDIRSTRNPSLHYVALSYHRLSSPLYACLLSISSTTISKFVHDALAHLGWHQAILNELSALHNSATWEFVPLPSRKSIIGYRWVFVIMLVLMVLLNVSKHIWWAKLHTNLWVGL